MRENSNQKNSDYGHFSRSVHAVVSANLELEYAIGQQVLTL